MPKAHTDWSKQPLGLMPDSELAERLGVSVHTVRRQRLRHGIRKLDMHICDDITKALRERGAMSAADLADLLSKQVSWVYKKITQMVHAGDVWRHRAGRGYMYTLAGQKYVNKSAINGGVPCTMTAREDEASPLRGTYCDDDVVDWSCVSFIDYDTEDRSDSFKCKRKRQTLTLRHCVELFGEVHAMRKKGTACWGCPQGAHIRLRHCYDLEPTKQRIRDALQVATEGSDKNHAEARLLRAYDES